MTISIPWLIVLTYIAALITFASIAILCQASYWKNRCESTERELKTWMGIEQKLKHGRMLLEEKERVARAAVEEKISQACADFGRATGPIMRGMASGAGVQGVARAPGTETPEYLDRRDMSASPDDYVKRSLDAVMPRYVADSSVDAVAADW